MSQLRHSNPAHPFGLGWGWGLGPPFQVPVSSHESFFEGASAAAVFVAAGARRTAGGTGSAVWIVLQTLDNAGAQICASIREPSDIATERAFGTLAILAP